MRFLIFIFAIESIALAKSGTIWQISNITGKSIKIECLRTKNQDEVVIKFGPKVIAQHSSLTHDWGEHFYNDGMGLNPGEWNCKSGHENLGSFLSLWGENLTLTVSESKGKLNIVKSAEKPDVATRK